MADLAARHPATANARRTRLREPSDSAWRQRCSIRPAKASTLKTGESMSNDDYTSDKLRRVGDGSPDRGPVCPKCQRRIPQFADLSPADEARTRDLIRAGNPVKAIHALVQATGCPLGWAKTWVIHEGRPHSETPGPRCGKPLRTKHARQCPHCKADWHSADLVPDHPQLITECGGGASKAWRARRYAAAAARSCCSAASRGRRSSTSLGGIERDDD